MWPLPMRMFWLMTWVKRDSSGREKKKCLVLSVGPEGLMQKLMGVPTTGISGRGVTPVVGEERVVFSYYVPSGKKRKANVG